MDTKYKFIYAQDGSALATSVLGYNHKSCKHIYYGAVRRAPMEFKKQLDKSYKYVFIYTG